MQRDLGGAVLSWNWGEAVGKRGGKGCQSLERTEKGGPAPPEELDSPGVWGTAADTVGSSQSCIGFYFVSSPNSLDLLFSPPCQVRVEVRGTYSGVRVPTPVPLPLCPLTSYLTFPCLSFPNCARDDYCESWVNPCKGLRAEPGRRVVSTGYTPAANLSPGQRVLVLEVRCLGRSHTHGLQEALVCVR